MTGQSSPRWDSSIVDYRVMTPPLTISSVLYDEDRTMFLYSSVYYKYHPPSTCLFCIPVLRMPILHTTFLKEGTKEGEENGKRIRC